MLIVYRPFVMKLIVRVALLVTAIFFNCSSAVASEKPTRTEGSDGASTLIVGMSDDARYILEAVPLESAMERFEMIDHEGRKIFYVAFTDTDVGGLVFVDKKLLGTVSHQDARSFYSCRGYTTTTQTHWAEDAQDWVSALLLATTPATTVTLHFSGKSTSQSIKEVVSNPVLSQLSLLDISTNPFSLLRKLNSAHDTMRDREKYEKTLQALKAIATGEKEEKISEVLPPEDVFFADGGIVLAYPRFALEYYVSGGTVKLAQQPSLHRISHARPALFYAPNAKWDQCTPQNWRNALPVLPASKAAAAP
jgi:hypothetical protein